MTKINNAQANATQNKASEPLVKREYTVVVNENFGKTMDGVTQIVTSVGAGLLKITGGLIGMAGDAVNKIPDAIDMTADVVTNVIEGSRDVASRIQDKAYDRAMESGDPMRISKAMMKSLGRQMKSNMQNMMVQSMSKMMEGMAPAEENSEIKK